MHRGKDGQCTHIFYKWILRRTGRADGCSITFNDKFHAIPLFQPEPIANLQRYRDLALAANGARACHLYPLLYGKNSAICVRK